MRHLLFALLLLLNLPAHAATLLTPEQQLADLHQLKAIIEEDYGPLQQKRERFGLDLDRLVKEYEATISDPLPSDQFGYRMKQFVANFRDSHFMTSVPSTAVALLGLTAEIVEGKVLVENLDSKYLNLQNFPFSRGDEIVFFGGRPVSEEIKELSSYFSMGNEKTALRIATFFLAVREAKRLPVPSGSVALGIRRRGSDEITSVTLPWIQKEKKEASIPSLRLAGIGDWCSEKSRIAPPPGAEVIAGVPFTAFTFPTAQGKMGFLRIPHYAPVDALGNEAGRLRFQQYEEVVRKFEAETVGLVIDQDFNCGGSVVFVNKLVSLFVRTPFSATELQFRASKGQIEGLSRQLAKFSPQTEGYTEFKEVIDEIRRAYSAGEAYTRRLPMRGFMEMDVPMPGGNTILPNPTGYTKPIVLLINEMSGSGGDLFPALMKDLGRAHLFGTHTMGAGGHLWDDPHLELKHSGLSVHPTRSLIFTPKGALIENDGITPHVKYEISENDFLHGFQEYLQAATQEVLRRL